MIDVDYIDVSPTTENKVETNKPPVRATPPKPPAKVKLKPEPEPKPAIPEPPANVDTSKVTNASKAFAAQSAAKLLVLLTWLGAVASKAAPLMMTDEEAIAIAIPMTTLLLRIKFIAELFTEYGQYFLSFDEWLILAVAIYAYYSRVEKEMERGHENVPNRPIRTEQAPTTTESSNGYGGIASPFPWKQAL